MFLSIIPLPRKLYPFIGMVFTIIPSLLMAQQAVNLHPEKAPVRLEGIVFLPTDPPPTIAAKAAVLFDAYTGKVLLKENETELRPVASTQKLLTALIIAESGNLDKPVVIEKSDTMEAPTKLGVRAGDTYTRRDLLTAMLVKSANDIAAALARDNAGSVPAFAEKMNQRMTELHGTSSHFENPNGLPLDNQYSSARDMAIVARAVYANPVLRDIVDRRKYAFRFASGKTTIIRNTNHLLLDYSFCNGMKTGYTEKSGHCLIASGSWQGRDVIAVILGEPVRSKIWEDGKKLLVYGLGLQPKEIAAARLISAPDGSEPKVSPSPKKQRKPKRSKQAS